MAVAVGDIPVVTYAIIASASGGGALALIALGVVWLRWRRRSAVAPARKGDEPDKPAPGTHRDAMVLEDGVADEKALQFSSFKRLSYLGGGGASSVHL